MDYSFLIVYYFVMNSIYKLIFLFVITFVFVCRVQSCNEYEKFAFDEHLDNYLLYNISHHDNIDETAHTHTHRHSENEQEHEHDHKNSSMVQYDYSLVFFHSSGILNSYECLTRREFLYHELISSKHLLKIFRPPIS